MIRVNSFLQRAEAENETLRSKAMAHLLDRPVAIWAAFGENGLPVRLDAMGLAVTAQVSRGSGDHALSAESYARKLWGDGSRKR